ncbi:hypothetical protein NC796_25800 [Aliifodinibius sp. S!AR15-10]|nr:hypothetical protein [Aliifodinibius sp. S!AR15-10]
MLGQKNGEPAPPAIEAGKTRSWQPAGWPRRPRQNGRRALGKRQEAPGKVGQQQEREVAGEGRDASPKRGTGATPELEKKQTTNPARKWEAVTC